MKYKDIYAKWLATELIKRGHELKKVIPNPEHSKFCIFVFVNTETLTRDLIEITKAKRDLQELAI
ncbi:hypothetical protein [Bacillus cereus group sp. IBL03679]|uniref:hypothetical protein n=1 Tax=Bacillus cereus group sp. IBL03679 TaxID=3240095 RepID=UPI003D2F928E